MSKRSPLRWLKGTADAVGTGLFAVLFLVFVIQITARFVFDRPLPWTDELAVILYVWVILWCAALVVPEREHVMFDLVWNAFGRKGRWVMRIAGNLLVGGLAAWAVPGCLDYVMFMRREATAVLGVPFAYVFAPFVVLLGALAVRAAWNIVDTLRGRGLEDAGIPSS